MPWKLRVTVHFGAFLALLWFHPSCAQWLNHIYVDPVKGKDNSSCLVPNNSSQPCQTLNYAFLYRSVSTQYVLSGGWHYLKTSLPNGTRVVPFTQDGLAITGLGSNASSTIIECSEPNAGLAFVGVTDILLQRVTFTKCGALRNSTSRNFHSPGFVLYQFYAVLYFYLCQNVNMSEVAVDYNTNATGVVMYDTIGTNNVAFSSFSENVIEKGSPHPGGGGFYIEFTYCIPGDDNCQDNVPSYVSANTNSTYHFDHCNFTGNQARNLNDINNSTYIIPNRTNHEAFGRGGGLSIFFKGNATWNKITVSQCWFERNQAQWGGGFFAEFHDSTSQNAVVIQGSTFLNNTCSFTLTSGTAGGGMRIGHYVYGKGGKGLRGNTVLVDNCRFLENLALNGGGLSISPTPQNTIDSQLAFIQVNNSHFEQNRAKLGAAIHISRFTLILEGKLLRIQLIACNMTNNSVDYYNGHIYEAGVGAVYVSGVPVEFRKNTNFSINYGSALAVVGTKVDFTDCTAAFDGNTGSRGGGIALLGSAWILINNATIMLFTDNTAITSGGAIYNAYTERENLKTYANCFIHHKDPYLLPDLWNATFYFLKNRAGNKKNSIHSTSILPCAWAGGSGVNQNISKIFSWKGWVCADDCLRCGCNNQTTSDAGSITFSHGSSSATVSAIPGETFKLPVEITDDFDVNINDETVFTATSANNETAMVDPAFSYVSGELIRVTGEEGKNFTLILNTAGNRVWHVNMTVQLEECPLGFHPSNSSGNSSAKCECANLNSLAHTLLFGGALKCNTSSISAILQNTYWIGVVNQEPVVAHCPPGFCYADPKTSFHELPRSVSQLNSTICQPLNRTGVLCGECESGYGPAVNSETYDCILCNSTSIAVNSVKYILSVYLPLCVLFTLIIVFNIRLTTGPANAFILYSQVIASTFDLSADGRIPLNLLPESDHVVKAYKISYGIFNLEFLESIIEPLCLGTKLNALDIIQLDYFVALFPMLMIILVIVFIKLKSCFRVNCCRLPRGRTWRGLNRQWRIGEGLTHAFAAFVLLSYTKFSLTSSYLVTTQTLVDVNGHYLTQQRVYYNGQYVANESGYVLKYYLPACIVFATFVAIPPLLLLDYPMKWFEACIHKVRCLRRLYPAVKVQILLDTFQGCYKNNMRFFAGLYLIFRLVINVSYIYTTWLEQYIIQQIVCTLFIVLLAVCQPYSEEKKLFNYVDILIFSDLAVINALSLYLYAYSQNHPGLPPPHGAFVIQYILVFLPLAYMITYITWHTMRPCLRCLWLEARKLITHCFRGRYYQPLDDVAANTPPVTRTDSTLQEDDDDHIEAVLKRAELHNTYRPSPTNAAPEIPKLYGQNESSEDSGLRTQHSSSNKSSGSGKYGSAGHSTCSLSELNESQTSED